MAASGDLATTVERLARSGPDLSVTVNLSVTVDGTELAVSTVEDCLRVQVPSVWSSLRLLQSERDRLPQLSRILSEADLTAEIRVGGSVIAVAGADATPGAISQLLSLGPVEVHPPAVALAAFRVR